MLMITEQHDADTLTFVLAGKLAEAWAVEFRKCWRNAMSSSKAKRIIVDLSEVTFVDEGGKELLSLMTWKGAELIARGVLMKSIVEEVSSRSSIS